jgi:tetratricopeptide (TPR) repeat protein
MDAVTYPDKRVQMILEEVAVPVRIELGKQRDLGDRFSVRWTPGLLWMTQAEKVEHRNTGFLPPTEFCAEVLFGCGQVAGAEKDWAQAKRHFDRVLERFPQSFAAPAALYWSGVAGKLSTQQTEALLSAWRRLLNEYPDSGWAAKVSFIHEAAARKG